MTVNYFTLLKKYCVGSSARSGYSEGFHNPQNNFHNYCNVTLIYEMRYSEYR